MGGVKALYTIRLLVLAILLTPADFGLIAIALAATGLLLNLTNFGLIPAVVQAENMDDARYDAVWTLEMTRSVIVTALTVLFAPWIAEIFAEPRAVLKEFGTELPDNVTLRTHDSNADMRYLVLPQRPAGTEGWPADKLAAIVTRDCMVGVALPKAG